MSRATRAVIRNLAKDHPDELWESVGTVLAYRRDQEHFTRDATAWLGDRSELRSSTINSADWTEVYAEFKEEES